MSPACCSRAFKVDSWTIKKGQGKQWTPVKKSKLFICGIWMAAHFNRNCKRFNWIKCLMRVFWKALSASISKTNMYLFCITIFLLGNYELCTGLEKANIETRTDFSTATKHIRKLPTDKSQRLLVLEESLATNFILCTSVLINYANKT